MSIPPPLLRAHQMCKAVGYGGTVLRYPSVLHFYHKAHKPPVHIPLDLWFAD